MQQRFKVSIRNNGLKERDVRTLEWVLSSKTPDQALKRSNEMIEKYNKKELMLSYNAKQFLDGLSIACEADIAGV